MTLARKGTRKLVLDDVEYRWTVAPDDEPGIAIVVELAAAPACRLVSWVEHGVAVSPGVVRLAILDAIGAGWVPSERGRDFGRRVPPRSMSSSGARVGCSLADALSDGTWSIKCASSLDTMPYAPAAFGDAGLSSTLGTYLCRSN